jgi:hypothetical protein
VTRSVFKGLNGSNPLGFMASVGLLRLLSGKDSFARLGFSDDGLFHAWIECVPEQDDFPAIVAGDAASAAGPQAWRLTYEKQEKKGVKIVADLKAPPEQFSRFLNLAINEWLAKQPERSDYATAFGTDSARDGKGNTKPTAFHFTAANQQFLGAIEETRSKITREWVEESLDDRNGKVKPGMNLRWDPGAERSRALMGANPNDDGTTVNAPLEWLAFRGLPAFPCVPVGNRIVTCGVSGRRQDELCFHWPLWSRGASYATVRSLLLLTAGWIRQEEQIRCMIESLSINGRNSRSSDRLQRDLQRSLDERRHRGVFAICTSEIRRTAQGFGNFGPARVQS